MSQLSVFKDAEYDIDYSLCVNVLKNDQLATISKEFKFPLIHVKYIKSETKTVLETAD